jgi:hypothetical protein
MNPGPDAQRTRTQLMIWWIVWASLLTGLCLIYFFLGRGQPLPKVAQPAQGNPLAGLTGLVPLFVSIIIRWLVLPRLTGIRRALPMFIIGIALAESCGLLGIFLGGVYKDDLFLLGVLGVVQYAPFFAKQYLEPKPQGFYSNN